MTKQEIVSCIFQVLSISMAHPHLSTFQSDAKFIDDLGLDSSLMLQLLMFLEVEHELSIPDDALMNADFETIRSLAQVLYESQGLATVEKGLEVYEDLKIHCVASNLSEIVKRNKELDHRILYFGVWDAEACVSDDMVLSYHSQTISHAFFTDWYERLYGMKINYWFEDDKPKDDNIRTLINLVEHKKPSQHIMVMLDMYQLPERKNEFSKDPFPHYLMLAPTSKPDEWMMLDPDYRWEGIIKKDRILNAVNQPSVSGGFVFNEHGARATPIHEIDAYYQVCMNLHTNPVTDAIRCIVNAYIAGKDTLNRPLDLSNIGTALEEIPVLSIRKYAYEHGFAFFWRELNLPEEEFDTICNDIDALVKNYKLIQFQCMKLGASQNRDLIPKILSLIDQQDEREFALKKRMHKAYLQWQEKFIQTAPFKQPAGENV